MQTPVQQRDEDFKRGRGNRKHVLRCEEPGAESEVGQQAYGEGQGAQSQSDDG